MLRNPKNTGQAVSENHERGLLSSTIEFWEHRSGRVFTKQEAAEMINGVGGFFSILIEWDTKARMGKRDVQSQLNQKSSCRQATGYTQRKST
jgi:hypothetical protein